MSDCVNLARHRMQAAVPDPMFDRSPSDAEGSQLLARRDPVLAQGKLGDRGIGPDLGTRVNNTIYAMAFCTRIEHAR